MKSLLLAANVTTTELDPDVVELLKGISERTSNDIIIYIIVLVAMLVIATPIIMYVVRSINKELRASRDAHVTEKKTLIDVIEKNTEAIVDLRGMINLNNTVMTSLLSKIDNNTSNTNDNVTTLLTGQKSLENKIDRMVNDHDIVIETSKKTQEHSKLLDQIFDITSDTHNAVKSIVKND